MKKDQEFKVKSNISASEEELREKFESMFKNSPLSTLELLSNLSLYMKRQNVARLLHFDDLYKKILGIHGEVMEFGVRWGPNLALLISLRGIYEPYNYTRKITGFDTFSGFSNENPLRSLGCLNFWVNSRGYNIIEMTHHIWLVAMIDRIIGKIEYPA